MNVFSCLFNLIPETTLPARVDLDRVICRLNRREPWSLRDAFEGTHIFGGTGSGKTSSSGRHFALAMLRAGFGGLVLTVKPDEAETWHRYARESGRESDLLFIRPGMNGQSPENPINFLEYEHRSTGGASDATNLTSLFLTACRAMDAGDNATEQPYWQDSLRQLLNCAVTLLILAEERMSVPTLAAVVASVARTPEEAKSVVWNRDSMAARLIQRAAMRVSESGHGQAEFSRVAAYFTKQLPGLPENTRASVISTFTTKADLLLGGTVRDLLCGETSPVATPDQTHQGKIVVVDMPVLIWNELGRFAQLLIKSIWQRATLRRGTPGVPVFLWADEAQHFVTDDDYRFLQTARSARAATVYLTQGVSNYHAMIGSRNARAATTALLGGFQTKIFHANGCSETNRWAEEQFGQEMRVIRYPKYTQSTLQIDHHPIRQPVIASKAFTQLRKGGRGTAEAYVFQSGRRWRTHRQNYLKAVFDQGRAA